MTHTEDRLTEAPTAAAGVVRQEIPLSPPTRTPQSAARHRRRWLVPLTAAGVALIVALAGAVQLLSRTPPDGGGRAAGPPRYYVAATTTGMQVRKTATGAVTAAVPTPFFIRRTQGLTGVAAATGDSGREFVIAYTALPLRRGSAMQTRLYSFHLTGAGRVAGLSPVNGGLLDGVEVGSALGRVTR